MLIGIATALLPVLFTGCRTRPAAERIEILPTRAEAPDPTTGDLRLPGTPGPHPAVIILPHMDAFVTEKPVSGSAPIHGVKHPSGTRAPDPDALLDFLAMTLPERGIATLRLPGGIRTGVIAHGFEQDAELVVAALGKLLGDARIDPARISVAGHGFSAVGAMMAAVREEQIKSLVLLAPPSAPLARSMLGRVGAELAWSGAPRAEIMEAMQFVHAISAGTREQDPAAVNSAYEKVRGMPWTWALPQLNGPEFSRSLAERLDPDPAKWYGAITQPMLILLGGQDPTLDLTAMIRAFERNGRGAGMGSDIRVIADADHTFRSVPPVRPRTRADRTREVIPEVADMIELWLSKAGNGDSAP